MLDEWLKRGKRIHSIYFCFSYPSSSPALLFSSLHCSLCSLSLLLGWSPNHLHLLIRDFVTWSLLISLISFFPLLLHCGTVCSRDSSPSVLAVFYVIVHTVYPCPGHLCPDFLIPVRTHPLNLNLGVTICRSLPWPFVSNPGALLPCSRSTKVCTEL